MHDLGLRPADAWELLNTLETCGTQLEEWEMTRCPSNEATVKVLFNILSIQPLRRLNLGYNALGPTGVGTLMGVANAWTASSEHLSLEMNGLSDNGCKEV